MSKNMKNFILGLVLIIAASCILVGAVMIKTNEEKWPPDDLYVFDNMGYMAFEEYEEKYIKIMICSLHKDGKNPVNKYKCFYLETEDGERFTASVQGSNDVFYEEGEILTLISVQFNLLGDFEVSEKIEFTDLIMVKEDGSEVKRNLGGIDMEIINTPETNDINGSTSSLFSGNIKRFRYQVFNESSDNIEVHDIYFGEYIKYNFEEFSIESKYSSAGEVDIEGPEDFGKALGFCVLKPKIKGMREDGSEFTISCSGDTVYFSPYTDKEIRKYLLEKEK